MHRQLIAITSTGVDRRKLDKDKLKLALEDPGLYDQRFAAFINTWEIPQPEIVRPVSYLRQISGTDELVLGPTDGKANIARSADVFKAWLDPDFNNWGCDVEGDPTGKQAIQVHEQIQDGAFQQIYGAMGANLEALCLSQGQIVQFFARKMYDKYLIRQNPDDAGYGYFRFLFRVGKEFFVAGVLVHSDGSLEASVRRLLYDRVWDAGDRNRFVLPQLAAQPA